MASLAAAESMPVLAAAVLARRAPTSRLLTARLPLKARRRLESFRLRELPLPATPLVSVRCRATQPLQVAQAPRAWELAATPAAAPATTACDREDAAPGPAAHRTWLRTEAFDIRRQGSANHAEQQGKTDRRSFGGCLFFRLHARTTLRSEPRPGGASCFRPAGRANQLNNQAISCGWLLTVRARPVPCVGARPRCGARVFRSGRSSRPRIRRG